MIKFINRATNTPMWVADERKEEYLRAGHRLAPVPCAKEPVEVVEVVKDTEEAEKPKKKVSRKR